MDKRDDGSGILNMGQEVAAGVWRAKAGLARKGGMAMHTISDIVADVERHCAIYNMIEDKFTYRLVYFINAQNGNEKRCLDTTYSSLSASLENIIKENLRTTNSIVLAAITALKDRECISLLSRSYGFSLDGYFQWLNGKRGYMNNNYGRKRSQWH